MSNFALRCVIFAENQKRMDIKELKINPKNPRKFDKATIDKMVKSITEFPKMLSLRPIVIDDDGTVLGGNLRLKALHAAGFEEIPDDWVRKASELTEEEKKRFIIADNVQFGEWDYDELTSEWDAGQLADWGLELPTISNEVEAHEDDYEIPDEIKTDIVLGDLFEFYKNGKILHKLLCGDSTDAEQVARLMNGEKADMVFTDPPYGMHLDVSNSNNLGCKDGWKNKAKNYTAVIGDGDDFKEELINTIFACFNDVKEVFIWGADYFAELIPNKNQGSWLVWDKRFGVEEMKLTFSEFELCWSKEKHLREMVRITWSGILGTEQEFDHKRHHPTQKPTKLSRWFIEKYSSQYNLIADIYLGSGSTMVASHQLNRKCYGMELEPKYCQVIIDRMLKLDNGLQILKNGNPL